MGKAGKLPEKYLEFRSLKAGEKRTERIPEGIKPYEYAQRVRNTMRKVFKGATVRVRINKGEGTITGFYENG